MPTLYVLTGPEVGRSFSVRPGDTLGRDPDRIVTLRHASISRVHAHLEEAQGVWYLVDDGSRNGLTFQGQRTARVALHDAAEVALGEIKLRFRLEAPAQSAAPSQPAPPPAPEDEEIFLEEPEEPERATAPVRPRTPARAKSPTRAKRPAAMEDSRKVLQYHRVEADSSTELSQYPGWVRAALVLLALGVAGAAAYLAFRGTFFVKQQVGASATQAP